MNQRLPFLLSLLWLMHLSIICAAQTMRTDTVPYKPKFAAFIPPVAFFSYGIASLSNHSMIRGLDMSTRNELQEDYPQFKVRIDDYLQFAPAFAVYSLNLAGIKGRNNLVDATGLFLLTEGIMGASVHSLKSLTNIQRPNGSTYNSFPSGHTSSAFAAAEFLRHEYKDVSPWIGYAGYTIATATGMLRMYNNKHWLSDVVAGAGIGILSAKAAYLIYPGFKKLLLHGKSSNYNLVPFYQQHSLGCSFHATL